MYDFWAVSCLAHHAVSPVPTTYRMLAQEGYCMNEQRLEAGLPGFWFSLPTPYEFYNIWVVVMSTFQKYAFFSKVHASDRFLVMIKITLSFEKFCLWI